MSGEAHLVEHIYGSRKPVARLKFALQDGVRWPTTSPGSLASFCPMEAIGDRGELDTSEARVVEEVASGYTRFRDGDVLVAKITPCFENGKGAVAAGLLGGIGFGTTELYVLTPSISIDPRFLYYITSSSTFRLLGEATMTGAAGQKRVPEQFVRDFPIWLPDISTQRRIADYLDAETGRIDALVAEKERMLALLEEKRAALISRAVTRGLDPNVPLKPSGLDWLGDIPAHWEVMRLKHFSTVGNGSTPNRDDPSYWENGDYPWLNSSVVNQRNVGEPSRYITEEALADCHLPKITPPALLVAITGQGKTRGRTAILGYEATINQHLAYVKTESSVAECGYLSFVFDSAYSFLRSDSESSGSTRGAITCEQLGNFYVPLPPREEQLAILQAIDTNSRRFETVEEFLTTSVALLRERRSALITAAVTGQIEPDAMRA